MTLYVGTSGYAYKEWKPDFYPPEVPQSKFLEHYGRMLTACEINATFYRLQSDATLLRWAEAVPESFRFATKAHRWLTHAKTLAPDAERRGFLDTFVRSVSLLGPRLGVVLFQLPRHRKRDDKELGALLDALPAEVPFAFEFREDSWAVPDIAARIAERGGAMCVSETEGKVPEALPPGPFAYIRLRSERYSRAARRGWCELLRRESTQRDVYAFVKHEGVPATDSYGGVGLAQWLATTL
jgi:uncharacterized protein YecE (DUF72 family)